ncbi:hypothetical protein niasHT_022260 [Heterodera trifolii]|uniref:Uncharacterized protein n=1 Tax=Heterodera trifolii TaxID=157864 RepID=A0ABD2KA98_9BILA
MRHHSAHFNAFFLGLLFLLILPFVVRTLADENERFANKIMSRGPTIAMVLQRQKQQKSESEETADVDDDEIGAGGRGGEGRGRHVQIEEEEEENDGEPQSGQQILCQFHANEELHAFVDQLCETCHGFFSHIHPNTRYLCRSDCFSTPTFKKCLSIFSKPSRSRRSAQMHFLMSAK